MTDTPSIPPALTTLEWAHPCSEKELRWACREVFVGQGKSLNSVSRHGLAALCLDGQPFGFTQEDVELLRKMRESYDLDLGLDGITAPVFEGIIAKIAALLPPK